MRTTIRGGRYTVERRVARERSPADFAVLFAGLLVLTLLTMILFWQFWHTNRIYTGVSVAGIPIGGLTRAAAAEHLTQQLLRYPLPPASIRYGSRQWPITVDHARAQTDVTAAVNQAYLVGRRSGLVARLVEQVEAAIGGAEIVPAYTVDSGHLRYVVGQIASEVREPARPGSQIAGVIIAPQSGVDVDVEATVLALVTALEDETAGISREVPLHVITLEPPPAAADAPERELPATLAVASSLLLRDERYGLEFALDPATLSGLLFSTQPLRVDEDKLHALLTGWAAQVNIVPRDARLRFDSATGSVVVVQSSQPGRRLDVDATSAAVLDAVAAGQGQAALAMEEVAPAVDSNRVNEMGIRELVVSATTYFAGSSPERIHNIEVPAAEFEGLVIPPNGVFSFNAVVKDVSAANGYEDALVIWGDRTAVGVGGGVCQVSTTIFRAAFMGGFPIVERYNHGYVVDWYGEPGLDATIFTPTVDFRFRNDTGAYLLLEPVVDSSGGTITFNFYGTKPNREVIVGEPVISEVKEPPPAVYTIDDSLEAGQRKQVDWAKQGMTVNVSRTIVANGESRTETLTSQYMPWRSVFLVGPGTDVPATPTPAPATEEGAGEESANPDGVLPTPTPSGDVAPTT